MKLLKIHTVLFALLSLCMASCHEDNDISAALTAVKPSADFTDARDGKTYRCVQIGNQIWMAENLAYFPDGGTLSGCFTWNQKTAVPSDLTIPKDVFIDLWNATADDPEHNWAVESMFPAERYKTFLSSYISDRYSQKEFLSHYTGIYYRAFMNAFSARELEYINGHLPDFRDQLAALTAEADAANGHYSGTYGYLYSLDCALASVPDGWRIPTDEDWMNLEKTLGLSASDAGLLNAWRGTHVGELLRRGGGTGFDALMGGSDCYAGGGIHLYINREESAYFWTDEKHYTDVAVSGDEDDGDDGEEDGETVTAAVREGIMRQLSLYSPGIWRGTVRLEVSGRSITCSVRCVRDVK